MPVNAVFQYYLFSIEHRLGDYMTVEIVSKGFVVLLLHYTTTFRPPLSSNSVPQLRHWYTGVGEVSICSVRVEPQAGHAVVSTALS